jgi:DNA-binding ferritin-like protein
VPGPTELPSEPSPSASTSTPPGNVAAAAGSFPLGRVTDIETITELVELIDGVTATTRRILDPLASAGAVGHDITVGILEGLEKYRWMLTAQTS